MKTETQYLNFLKRKIKMAENHGFDPKPSHDMLFPHQKDATQWALRGGRRAIFASFGLGKTFMQLELARQCIEKTGKSFLIGLPLGVKLEFLKDAEKMGLKCFYCLDDDVWTDINRMNTLNADQVKNKREKHVCPLQIDIVERCIERYSMPGEVIYDPFGGIGTVPFVAVKMGRFGVGCELFSQYWADGAKYLKQLEYELNTPKLFA